MIIKASEYGVVPNTQSAHKLNLLFEELSKTDGEKTLVFEKGDYFIDSEQCPAQMLYITNTAGDKEYRRGETPHRARVALNLNGIKNLKIEGNGARFVMNGRVTNAALQECENVEINDIEITAVNPDLHELTVVSKTKHSVDFCVDDESEYEFKGGKMYFKGKDYYYNPLKKYRAVWYIGLVKKDTPNTIKRVNYLFAAALAVKQLAGRIVRVYYPSASAFDEGDKFYLFSNRRENVGIFVNRCKNITLNDVKQRFNYSLALVAQDTENITVNRAEFAPDKASKRLVASTADFVQICMCRGTATVTDSYFEGACDDCLNAHGVHLKIKSVKGNKIIVSYMHPQTHAYNPIHAGDEIAFIKPVTLLEAGRAMVKSSRLVDEYNIELELSSAEAAVAGDVIEDITACPDVVFKNNMVNRIITRGLLLTTRGRVLIEGNRFISNSMSGILLSDDASSWYESGMCTDVTIKGNVFEHCGEAGVLIKPENRVHKGAVHKNIKIVDNDFKHYNGFCIRAKSTDGIMVSGNTFADDNRIETKNCTNVTTDF